MNNSISTTALVAALVLPLTLTPSPARSSGFPVIDIAALVQSLQDFIQQTSHLVQLVNQYQQMITDYQLELENLEGYLDPDNLKLELAEALASEYGAHDLYDILANPPENLEEILLTLEEIYELPPPAEVLESEYAEIFEGESLNRVTAAVDRDWERVERITATMQSIAANRRTAESRTEKIREFGARIDSFGPNQTAEAAQLQAAEMNLMLQQMEQLLAGIDQMIVRQENVDRETIDARARGRQAQLRSIQNARSQAFPESNASSWYFGESADE